MSKTRVVSDNMTWEMMWQQAQAQSTQGGAGRLGFGTNEIMLSTRDMLSQSEEDPRWESQCGHETWPAGHPRWPASLTSGPLSPTFAQSTALTPLLLPVESVKKV
jgi:hypothetical protein